MYKEVLLLVLAFKFFTRCSGFPPTKPTSPNSSWTYMYMKIRKIPQARGEICLFP